MMGITVALIVVVSFVYPQTQTFIQHGYRFLESIVSQSMVMQLIEKITLRMSIKISSWYTEDF